MNEEKIKKAVKETLINKPISLLATKVGTFQRGFIAGAQWRINSVWHDASEKPNKNQLVLFECRKTYGKRHSVDFGEIYESIKNVIVRWAYIIDLLPERKEETE